LSLKISNVSFSYGPRSVLKNVSLEVEGGEILALIGPNGAGKSTLLKCVSGLLKPNDGEILVEGKDVSKLPWREKARLVGYLPQYTPIIFPVTVFESVLLGRLPHFGVSPRKGDIEAVHNILESLNLSEFADRYIDEISGGERQRAYVARILAQETKVILFDEPTANLDLKYQHEVMELIGRSARERNAATVVALHDVNLALKYADFVAVLNGGELIAKGKPEDVVSKGVVKRVYGVDAHVVEFDGRPRILL